MSLGQSGACAHHRDIRDHSEEQTDRRGDDGRAVPAETPEA